MEGCIQHQSPRVYRTVRAGPSAPEAPRPRQDHHHRVLAAELAPLCINKLTAGCSGAEQYRPVTPLPKGALPHLTCYQLKVVA
jgi:hypothetical protein